MILYGGNFNIDEWYGRVIFVGEMEDIEMKNDMKNEQVVSFVIVIILMVVIIVVLVGVLYVWVNSFAVDQLESGICNSYIVDDAAVSTSGVDDDVLISVCWQYVEDDLNWVFVVMKLSVGDNIYDCFIDGIEECVIG